MTVFVFFFLMGSFEFESFGLEKMGVVLTGQQSLAPVSDSDG